MSAADVRGGAPDDEAALEESAEELYEDAPCGYLTTAVDGTIRRANRTFFELTGYSAADLVERQRFYDLLPPGAKIYYETHYAPLLQMQGWVREIALEILRPDGGRLPVLVNATLKRDESGQPQAVRITVFDASDRRRYEQELLEARLEAERRAAAATALAHVSEGVALVDDDGRIVLLNPAAERIFGVSLDEVRGLPLTAVSPDWSGVAARIPVVRRADVSVASAIVPLTLRGETRWLAASGEPAQEGIVYTLRDVTDERRLEDMRADIVSIVSHELRTPVAGVYGAAKTLASIDEKLSEDDRPQLVGLIAEQSGRLSRVVEQIHLAQQLDTDGLGIERRHFDVSASVASVVESSRAWRSARDVEVTAEPGVEVEGDPQRFEQALANLLDNALRYSPPETAVRVSVERRRATARVTVADEGPGIPDGERERIFAKFFRLDPRQTSGTSGAGLGLYIARELVRRMQGEVGLVPTERGATFFVDLPLSH